MPKRTNDFQDLVTLIQEALVPQGAKVTASAMVPGPTSGTPREIDILIESEVGPYHMKIAVEAKDEGRKLDATKMEAIIGKYRGRGSLVVNKVAVVAHRGFTEEAKVRAKDEDIELLTLDELNESNVCEWCQSIMPKMMQVHFDPMPYSFELEPPLPPEIDRIEAMKDGQFICTCHGNDRGTPAAWIMGIIATVVIPNRILIEKMHEIAITEKGRSILNAPFPITNHVFRYKGVDYPVTTFTAKIQYIHASGEMRSQHYQVCQETGERIRVMHSEGLVGGHQIELLMPLNSPESRGIIKVNEDAQAKEDSLHPKKKWRLMADGWVEEHTSES